ncbi:MAG TPA: hypothetical protein VG936_11460 [Lacunisphaera sp.]|nr:hypothetical protein [Lacunisphaera sp.]
MNPVFKITLGLLCTAVVASAANDRIITAVFSRAANGYHREREADGSYKREYYALTPGHYYPGVGKDGSIDPVKFPQVASLAAQLLATKNYWFAKDASQATLLLEISWGKTIPLNDGVYRGNTTAYVDVMNQLTAIRSGSTPYNVGPEGGGPSQTPAGRLNSIPAPLDRKAGGALSAQAQLRQAAEDAGDLALTQTNMFNDLRRKADEHNANLLGYTEEINRRENPTQFGGAGTALEDLIEDIENERYYIIIAAYDFAAAKKGEMKQQWVTRVSVQAQGNRFNESAAYMLAKASRYFGQDSGRLIREFDREGKVTLGDLQVVGVVPQSQVEKPIEKK